MAVHRRDSARIVQHPNGLAKRHLIFEPLECRQLLAGDGIDGDAVGPLGEDDPMPFFGGTATGSKWLDTNGNGIREANEPGLAGITIYADENNNRRRDPGEQWTKTQRDNPRTKVNESGQYVLEFLSPGPQIIREIIPDGFQQTFPTRTASDPVDDAFASVKPNFLDIRIHEGDVYQAEVGITIHPVCIRPFELDVIVVEAPGVTGVQVINHDGVQLNGCGGDMSEFHIDIIVENPELESFEIGFVDVLGNPVLATIPVFINGRGPGGGHAIDVQPGQTFDGLDFGNRRIQPRSGSIEGRKWLDRNGNGRQDPGEPGLGGVDIYVDLNENGRLDRHEPRTRTRYENPDTDFDEGGLYSFELRPGEYVIREIVPRGFQQTFPQRDAIVLNSETGRFATGVALDLELAGVQSETSGDDSKTHVELSVLWPDGCGQLLADRTSHAVIGNSILVEMHGHQTGTVCTEALKTDTITVAIPNLDPGAYHVVGTLHEPSREAGREIATLGVVGEIQLGPDGSHRVTVEAGSVVSGLDFGNRQTGPGGSIHGLKWHDLNGDGRRQRGEPGLGGVTIYVDANRNGMLDEGEISTKTAGEDSTLQGIGSYTLAGLEPGQHTIREVVPDGFRQTFPHSNIDDPAVDADGQPLADDIGTSSSHGHSVELRPGHDVKGINFGNQSTELASVHGAKWNDVNGNGKWDSNEPGLAGVTIYVDTNSNGRFDESEPSAVSMQDDPNTSQNELGMYWIEDVKPGRYAVREIIEDGYRQTFPRRFFFGPDELSNFQADRPRGHFVRLLPGQSAHGLNFGNQKLELGSIHGTKWLDKNGNGTREPDEPGIAGVTIYVDANRNGQLDDDEPRTLTREDDPKTAEDERGHYWLEDLRPLKNYQVRELVPAGYEQTFPRRWRGGPWFPRHLRHELPGPFWGPDFTAFADGFHWVWVGSGQVVEGIDFGNHPMLESGAASGLKWNDLNGNGRREADEPGLPGVTIYSDLNLNGQLDFNEPRTVTRKDDPNTSANEAGTYTIKLTPGEHLILEVVPRGFEQRYPNTARRIMFPYNLGHGISVEPGKTTENVDFGNHRGPLATSMISGMTWADINANGVIDRGEEPVPGRVIYLDDNDNGRLDDHERRTVAGEPEIDVLLAEGSSDYFFQVPPGDYIVRQVVPFGFAQSFPFASFVFGETIPVDLPEGRAISFDLIDASLPSTSPTDDGKSRMQLTFESVWPTGGVEITTFDASISDDGVISVDVFAVTPAIATTVITPMQTTVIIDLPEIGRYSIQATLHEARLEDISEPMPELVFTPSYEVQADFQLLSDTAHRVSIGPDDGISGLHFGSFPVPVANPVTTGNDEQPVPNRPGDTNDDGIVNFTDFLVLSNNFGKKVDRAFADADFSGDGFVKFDDFLILAENFDA